MPTAPHSAPRSRVRRRLSDDLETAEPRRADVETADPVRRAPLVVGAADDRAEHEADAVADRVMARRVWIERGARSFRDE